MLIVFIVLHLLHICVTFCFCYKIEMYKASVFLKLICISLLFWFLCACLLIECKTAVSADRLYFVTLKKKPRSSPAVHYFSTDDEFVYNRFFLAIKYVKILKYVKHSQ